MSLSVRSCSPGISSWAQDQESGGLGGEERGGGDRQTDRQKRRGRKRGEGKRVFFNSLWQGRLVQFHETPISHSRWPPKLRAQESTQKELWETRDSDSREHAYKHCFCFFSSFFKITFPILEDVLLKKSQFKIVLKTYLKIGL